MDTSAAPATLPDRADSPVSETTERFLRAIVTRVPLADIEELHLFSPLRQGGVETGIAVVAVRVPVAPVPDPSPEAPELALDAEPDGALEAGTEATPDAEAESAPDGAPDAQADEPVLVSDAGDPEAMPEAADSPYAPEATDAPVLSDAVVAADTPDTPDTAVMPEPPLERHTVYTARYRLVLKGPDRGKWESSLVAEADAPLVTVEAVVRGVQRRAGEASEIVRFTAPQLAKAARLPEVAVPGPG